MSERISTFSAQGSEHGELLWVNPETGEPAPSEPSGECADWITIALPCDDKIHEYVLDLDTGALSTDGRKSRRWGLSQCSQGERKAKPKPTIPC